MEENNSCVGWFIQDMGPIIEAFEEGQTSTVVTCNIPLEDWKRDMEKEAIVIDGQDNIYKAKMHLISKNDAAMYGDWVMDACNPKDNEYVGVIAIFNKNRRKAERVPV